MIVTLKTLQQKSFKIEIDEGETVCNVIGRSYVIFKLDSYLCRKVLALKERIEKEQGPAYPVAGQKLIYAGKLLYVSRVRMWYTANTRAVWIA